MSSSSNQSHFAVVVPQGVQKCHDVLSASSDMVKHTPGPFGINVQPCDEDCNPQGSPYPLIYVSEAAAKDRSQDRNPLNGTGVRAGWYVIATPGRFVVHVSQLKSEPYGLPWEDVIEVNLKMDGHSIHRRKTFVQKNNNYRMIHTGAYLFKGFVEKGVSLESGTYDRLYVIRPFSFAKVSPEESNEVQSSNVGTITLDAKAGQIKQMRPSTSTPFSNPMPNERVSEKTVAKHGTTMKVSHNSSPIVKMRRRAGISFRVINHRMLPEVEIKLRVRERSWLRSRRLIDDNDQPVTYASFRTLLRADQSLHRHTPTQRNNVKRNSKAGHSIKEEAVDLEVVATSTSTHTGPMPQAYAGVEQ